ncbi:hypothetical protein M407DRAFT_135894 [Tulasnella calospora MUT 4182]|uniref:Uncharacterized protein n=1 Tax=Tulasnella calospora MUT 4182 TaxID=1051891 RepID=A0A0C3LBQ7_9AGAM|nr:hypothetical protein M407DRAFT_135894 [Tulasnella calospora MUT 4182]
MLHLFFNVGSNMSALEVVEGLERRNYRNAVKRTQPTANWTLVGAPDSMKTSGAKGSIHFSMWHRAGVHSLPSEVYELSHSYSYIYGCTKQR